MSECKVIAIGIQKGGCGKTSTTQAIGSCLAKYYGKRVLLIDLEPTGNLTFASNLDLVQGKGMNDCTVTYGPSAPQIPGITDKEYKGTSVFNALKDYTPIEDCIFHCGEIDKPFKKDKVSKEYPCRYDVIPSDYIMSASEQIFIELGKERCLAEKIEPLKEHYDYILIDTPPAYGILVINALTAADYCIIPLETSWFALQGIGLLNKTVNEVRKWTNPSLVTLGLLLIKYDARTILSRDICNVLSSAKDSLQTKIFENTIRTCSAVGKAQGNRTSLFMYDTNCTAAEDYIAVTKEILWEIKQHEQE